MRSAASPAPGSIGVSLPMPEGWFDKTMIVYSAPLAPGDTMASNIVVSRDALAVGEDFPGYCERQLATFTTSLPRFSLHERQIGDFGGRRAARIDFEWAAAAGQLGQVVTFIDAGHGVVVSFAGSAPADEISRYRSVFQHHLERLEIGAAPGVSA
jgi:hypothetical protein